MTSPIDTAYVLIEPETATFKSKTTAAFDETFAQVEPIVADLVGSIEKMFGELTAQLAQDMGEIRTTAIDAFDSMVMDSETTARAAQTAFDDMAMSVDAAFAEIGVSAGTAFEEVDAGGAAAGAAVARDMEGGAARAKEALLGVGETATKAFEMVKFASETAIVVGLAEVGKKGLETAGELQQIQTAFAAMLGSEQQAGAFMQKLQAFSMQTPFQFKDLAQDTALIMSFGKSVGISQDQIIPMLKTIGDMDATLGLGQSNMKSVISAMQEMAGQGTVTEGVIRRISMDMPGFNAKQAIAAGLGVSVAQAQEMIRKGMVSSADGIQYLLKGMQQFPGAANHMVAQSHTLLGAFSSFKDVINISLSNAFTPIIPALTSTMVQVAPILGKAIDQIAPAIGHTLIALLPILTNLISALAPILAPLLEGLAGGLKLIAPVLGPLGQALGGIAQALAPVLTMAGQLIAALGPALTPIVQALTPAISGLVAGLQPIINALVPIITQLGSVIGAVLAPVFNTLGQIFRIIGPPLGQIVQLLGQALSPILNALGPIVTAVMNALQPLWPVLTVLAKPIMDILVALMPLINLLAQLLVLATNILAPFIKLTAIVLSFLTSKAIVPIIELIAKGLNYMLSPLQKLVGPLQKVNDWFAHLKWGQIMTAIGHAFEYAWKATLNFFGRLGPMIGNWLSSAWHSMLNFFGSLGTMIWNALSSIPGLLERAIAWWFHTAIFALGYYIGTMLKLWENLPSQIWSIITTLFNTALHLWITGIEAIVNYVLSAPERTANAFMQIYHTTVAIVTGLVTSIINWFAALSGRIINFVSSMWNGVKTLFITGVNTIVSWVASLPSKAGSAISNLWSSMLNGIGDIVGNFYNLGKNIIQGLIDGVKSMVGTAIDSVSSGMKDIYHGALTALGVHSPSKLFAYVGQMTMAGFTQGVKQNTGPAVSAVNNAILPQRVARPGQTAAAGATYHFGPGSVVVQFSGVVPTAQQAYQAGVQAAHGVLDTLVTSRQSTHAKLA